MKKFKQLVILLVCVLLLSGCVKEHYSMNINKDKSMTFEVEMLLSDTLLQNSGEDTNSELTESATEYEKKGFTVTPKKEDGYSGYTLTKRFKNIDDLSKKETDDETSLDGLIDNEENTSKIFKLEKGFLKNTYTAVLSFEFDENQLTDTDDEEALPAEDNSAFGTNDGDTDEEEAEDGFDNFDGMLNQASEMEFTYVVNLPYKAINHNATKTANNGKQLTWDMTTKGKTAIEFSFPMYNLTNLIILGAACLAGLIVIIVLVVVLSKKKKSTKETLIHTDYDSSIVGQIEETNTPQDDIPAGPTNHEFAIPEEPQVNVTQGTVVETPTMTETVVTPQPMPQETVVPASNVTQGPSVDPTMNQGVQLDIPNMVPLGENDTNIIDQK